MELRATLGDEFVDGYLTQADLSGLSGEASFASGMFALRQLGG